MYTKIFHLLLFISFLSAFAEVQTTYSPPSSSEIKIFQKVKKINIKGVPNFYQIAPNIYRSAQPTKEGFINLEKMGIKTIINLRSNHSDNDEAKETSLNLQHVPIKTWHINDEHVAKVMALLENSSQGPFLIHCQHGADRTGLMSAMYRILYQNWTPEEALNELTSDKFGFHSIWKNIPQYIKKVNIQIIKEKIIKTQTLLKQGKKLKEINEDDLKESIK